MSQFNIRKRSYDSKYEVARKIVDPRFTHKQRKGTIEMLRQGYILPDAFVWVTVAVFDSRKEAFKFVKGEGKHES